ncbi:MAG: transcription antitermination factor NusB [Spirochaetaceae bacterium]|jgi:N utilization substance protein B|nr:transcription antitermination factor NusB [Spirochaetaceae bacterium]
MSRRKARILALEALYAYESAGASIDELLRLGWVEEKTLSLIKEEELAYSRILIAGTIENIELIDSSIKKHLIKWEFSRLKRVDLAVLRISVYSLLFQKDIHPAIIIDEAIELCIRYGTDDSFKFVNALLDAIKNEL